MVTHNPALMSAIRRIFTDEEKLEILHQANHIGITEVLRKHTFLIACLQDGNKSLWKRYATRWFTYNEQK